MADNLKHRLATWTIEFLVSIDQFAHVVLGAPKYLIKGGPCPNADETISSIVGREAIKGHRWALVAEWVIDGIFGALGQKNHCRSHIEQLPLIY